MLQRKDCSMGLVPCFSRRCFVSSVADGLVLRQRKSWNDLGVVETPPEGPCRSKNPITNVDTSEARTVASGDDGAFRVPGLRPGHYSVRWRRTV